ncbi:MAG: preprotein translocase subunit SecG [Eubacteriales bacterium]
MSTLRIVLTILFAIDCVAMIVVIMMQQGKDRGLGAIAGMSSGDTYWGRNKGRSKEGMLVKLTRVLVIGFVALAVVLNFDI